MLLFYFVLKTVLVKGNDVVVGYPAMHLSGFQTIAASTYGAMSCSLSNIMPGGFMVRTVVSLSAANDMIGILTS